MNFKQIGVRLEDHEYQDLLKQAKGLGVSMAEFVRLCLVLVKSNPELTKTITKARKEQMSMYYQTKLASMRITKESKAKRFVEQELFELHKK